LKRNSIVLLVTSSLRKQVKRKKETKEQKKQ
jgi:hypothetical protein